MRHSSRNTGLFLIAAAAIVLATIAVPHAQRRGNANGSFGVPVATNTILEDPNSYYGKQITISAAVENMVSKTSFLMDQRRAAGAAEVKSVGKPILVIAPFLTKTLEARQYLLVSGQLVKFDPAAVTKIVAEYRLDLPAEALAKYTGLPVLVANSVLDAYYAELGKKPAPPATPDELAMSTTMKSISAAAAVLRTASPAAKDAVLQNAAALQPLFTKIEVTWDDLGQTAAAQYARDGRAFAAEVEEAASEGNWDAVKANATSLNAVCGQCHGAYRDRMDDGTFRFRVGSF
ncbi:MAG: hypothetical protein ABL986_01415 [Vicinamibacterales bacterium]